MKIIISHDVDHLYPLEHVLHDLIIPKLWARSLVQLFQGKISAKTFFCRLGYPFYGRYNRLEEIVGKDREAKVPSTFFIGMERGLGMSYGRAAAARAIKFVESNGFDTGVHGIDFEDIHKIRKERMAFRRIARREEFGVRMHYVRYDMDTFKKLSQVGYVFDTSEFDKKGKLFRKPYKVGNMWEFPLHIMDGYIMPPGDLKMGVRNTKRAIRKAERSGNPYCTILYHDYLYNPCTYPAEKRYYDWLLSYIKRQGYELISYRDAIREMEERNE